MKERRHGPNQNFERAKDFKGTLKNYLNHWMLTRFQ